MKLKTMLLFIPVILMLVAANPVNLKGKIKSIRMNRWPDALIYHYDDMGRISGLTTDGGFETKYEYKGNTIIAKTKKGSTVTMFLNSNGLVDSLTDVDSNRTTKILYDQNGMGSPQFNFGARRDFPYSGCHILPMDEICTVTTRSIITISKKYTYDDAGFIKEEKVYEDGKLKIISTSAVENGNITSYKVKYPVRDTIYRVNPKTLKVDTSIVSQNDFRVENSFDPDKANSLETTSFFGKSNKNITLKSIHYDGWSSTAKDSDVTTFKYTFDAEGRVSTLIKTIKTTTPAEYNDDAENSDTCSFTYY